MNDPNEVPKQAPELTEDDLGKVTGGAPLQIEGIKGESQDKGHEDWIELQSF